MGAFVSEEHASRNVHATGAPDVRQDPEYVLVMDRVSGRVQEEFVPPTIRMALRSLYATAAGRFGAPPACEPRAGADRTQPLAQRR
jgi:hypothetical protein